NELTPRVSDYCQRIQLQLSDGQIYEVNLAAEDFISRAATLFERGLLITVDYGAERTELLNASHRFEGTLRAFRRHRLMNDVLAHPGEQDLTTTVDWTQVIEAGDRNGLQNLRLERLDKFLLHEGLTEQLSTLSEHMTDIGEVMNLRTSARDLIIPNGLAAHF